MVEDPVETAAATVRAFVSGSRALRAVVLLDRGEGIEPVIVDHAAGGAVEVIEGEAGRMTEIPPGAPATLPFDLAPVSRLPPLVVDPAAGELAAPLGAVAAIGRAVRELAGLFGGHSVVTAVFETDDDDVPLVVAARSGEPLLLSLADEQFPMPDGWP
jgi:hypothetical protein